MLISHTQKYRFYFVFLVLLALAFSNMQAKQQSINTYSDILQEEENAENTQEPSLGLKEILNLALANNKSVSSLDYDVLSAKQNYLTSNLKFIPSLNVTYNFESSEASNNASSMVHKVGVAANWEVFSGFATMNEIKQNEALYKASVANKAYGVENLYLQIIQSYYNYFNALDQVASLEQKLIQIKSNLANIQNQYNAGLTTIDNLESLKAQVWLSEYDISNARLTLEQNRLMLNYLTGKELKNIARQTITPPKMIIEEREDLKSMKEKVNSIIYQNKQLNYYPTISIFNNYTFTNFQNQSATFRATAPANQNIVGIQIVLPLFSDFGLAFQKQSFKYQELSAAKNLAYNVEQQKKDVEYYKLAIKSARTNIKSAQAGLISARISYDNIAKKYNAGLVTFTDYLQALSTKYNAEATYNQSLNNYELQKAYYIFYSGQRLLEYIK